MKSGEPHGIIVDFGVLHRFQYRDVLIIEIFYLHRNVPPDVKKQRKRKQSEHSKSNTTNIENCLTVLHGICFFLLVDFVVSASSPGVLTSCIWRNTGHEELQGGLSPGTVLFRFFSNASLVSWSWLFRGRGICAAKPNSCVRHLTSIQKWHALTSEYRRLNIKLNCKKLV